MIKPTPSKAPHIESWRKVLAVCALLMLFSLVTGCSTVRSALGSPLVTKTNTVETVVTMPAVTNQVSTPAGPVSVVVPEKTVTNWTTNIVVEVNPIVTKGIQTAQAINSAVNPTPTAPIINVSLGLLAAGLGWFARLQSKRKQEHLDALQSVIAGVEQANHPETKAAIASMSQLWGTRADVDAHVQAITKA